MPASRARLVVSPLPPVGEAARLSPEEAAHARARRLRRGDPVILLDGTGRLAHAVLKRLDGRGGEVAVEGILEPAPLGEPIALYVAGLRAERLAWIAEKATELGAASVSIVETALTQSFRASGSVLERLERVAREAAKQCEAARWPRFSGPVSFEEVISDESSSDRLILDFSGAGFPSKLSGESAALLVGPEGGWTETEVRTAISRGWKSASLPAGKLRAETAAIAALLLARAALERGRRD